MAKILAEWLEKDYQIKKGQIVSRDELYYIINKEKKKIPDGAVWFKGFSSKDNKDLIINVVKLLKHTHCLQLAREYSDVVQMEKAKRTIVRWPFDDPELHGYAYMENGIIWADGETHKNTLNENMYAFCNTMLIKRTEDRFIIRSLGLYEQDFFSETEFGGEDPEEHKNSITPDEIEERKHRERIIDIKKMVDILKEENADFNPDVFSRTLIGKDKSEYTKDDWKVVYKALCNKMEGK